MNFLPWASRKRLKQTGLLIDTCPCILFSQQLGWFRFISKANLMQYASKIKPINQPKNINPHIFYSSHDCYNEMS